MGGHPTFWAPLRAGPRAGSGKVGTPPIPPFLAVRYRHRVLTPDAVRATVLGRIRRMARNERAVVMRASVIGRRFDLCMLMATATCSEVTVRAALERACSLQLIVTNAPGCERYSFRHALTRDIIYAELLTVRIRPLHRRIARALERTGRTADVSLDELAYHSWAAGDARRTLRYNELAGDNAAAVHARDDARRYYTRARSLIDVDSLAFSRLTEKLRAMGDG
jgi:predicted ATPase